MTFIPVGRFSRPAAPWSVRRREIVLARPPRVWRALIEPAEIAGWWADRAEVDLRPGGRYLFGGPRSAGGAARGDAAPGAEVIAIEPESRLELRWPIGGTETRVVYELANVLESTEVLVTHEADLAPAGIAPPGMPSWWCVALHSLRSFVEKGRADLRIDFEAGRAATDVSFSVGVTTFPWVIWRKLTDPRELERWWARRADVDLRPGGAFHLGLEGMGPGAVIDVEEGRRLVHDWAWPGGARGRVEWTLEETDEETRVTVRDAGPWDPGAGRDAILIHWAAVLLDLEMMSERGTTPREYQDA